MNVNILGQYNFNNFTMLNPLMSEEEIVSTSIHEYTHFILSTRSIAGITEYCLQKIVIPPNARVDKIKKEVVSNFLMSHSKKVQEGVAVFIECIYKMLVDKHLYKEYILELKNCNKEYYKYVKPLINILNLLSNFGQKEDILKLASGVYNMALLAMDIEIYNLDASEFTTNAKIQRLISRKGFSEDYLPNKRFLKYIEIFDDVEDINEFEKRMELFWENKKNINIEDEKIRLNKIKTFILKLFEDSENCEMYKARLEHIEMKEIQIAELYVQQIPSTFSEDFYAHKIKKVSPKELMQLSKKEKYSMLFLMGNIQDNINTLFKTMGKNKEINKCTDEEIVMHFSLENKIISASIINCKQIDNLLESERESVLLSSYKNFDYVNNCILKHSLYRKMIFIYCDRTYKNASEYLDMWKNQKVYYRYMEYKNMLVLLAKFAENCIFVLPMTSIVASEACLDIENNRKNMILACESGDEKYDSHIIINENRVNEIDTIINCLFFLFVENNDRSKNYSK